MLHYDEYGRPGSPALLLLHGAAALDTFSQQYDLAEKYRLIVPHLPGAGENAGRVYRPEETVKELLELISSLGLEKPAVMGHSLGAQLAVLLLCKAPDLFSCGIFLSAWVNPRKKTVAAYSRLATLSSAALKWGWLVRFQGRYWHFTPAQAQRMAAYSRNITPRCLPFFFHQHPGFGPAPGISGGARPHAGNLRQPGSQGYASLSDTAGGKSPLRDGSAARLRP